jgi:hypothetical protein
MQLGLNDLFLTPLYLLVMYLILNRIKRSQKNPVIRQYFIPAFTVKIIGAIGLGLIYQFYYGGGDTFNYYNDTKVIWEAFLNSPETGLRLIFAGQNPNDELYNYTRRIYFYADHRSAPVVRVAAFLGFLTFNTYTVTALLFACLSFTGVWALYKALYDLYPAMHRQLAIAVFFIPSVFFWGSGLMKDSITLAALGWLFYAFYFGIIRRKNLIANLLIIFLAAFVLKTIKVYILMSFIPAASLWLFLQYRAGIRSAFVRAIALPLVLAIAIPAGYFAVIEVSKEDTQYQIDKIAETAKTSSEWLAYLSNLQGGSGYSLGSMDGTTGNMLSLMPRAVFVTLYQPFLWQTRNPVMLLSALEATFFIFLTLRIFWEVKLVRLYRLLQRQPFVLFCLLFAVVLSFGVGIASYNFGTLVRYKIPMMPFFLSALYIIRQQSRPQKVQKYQAKRFRKLRQFA